MSSPIQVYFRRCLFFLWHYSRYLSLVLSIEASYSHTIRHAVGLLWTSDRPVAEASTYTAQHNI
jgi:hypothetical protein